jgi:hypothetical protein
MALFRTFLHFERSIQVPQTLGIQWIFMITPSGTPYLSCFREKSQVKSTELLMLMTNIPEI